MSSKPKRKNPRLSNYQKQKKAEKEGRRGYSVGSVVTVNNAVNEVIAENRIGEFNIDSKLIDGVPFAHYQLLQSQFVIVRMEPLPHNKGIFIVRAFSPIFEAHDSLPPVIPKYKIDMKLSLPEKEGDEVQLDIKAEKMTSSQIILPGQ